MHSNENCGHLGQHLPVKRLVIVASNQLRDETYLRLETTWRFQRNFLETATLSPVRFSSWTAVKIHHTFWIDTLVATNVNESTRCKSCKNVLSADWRKMLTSCRWSTLEIGLAVVRTRTRMLDLRVAGSELELMRWEPQFFHLILRVPIVFGTPLVFNGFHE